MISLSLHTESSLRLGAFLAAILLLATLETLWPRRRPGFSRARRWTTNLGISLLNSLLVRLLVPVAGVGAAILAARHGFGLLQWLDLPALLEALLFLLAFDFTIYAQHRLFHRVPWLWRLHRMHHTDLDYDFTTGNRFHPVSTLISSLVKTALILAMGPAPAAVLVAELLLNLSAMFNHSNIRIPVSVDRWLRLLVVTPDMHRVHHSVDELEHNRNFGFNFPWWDRLLGTYLSQPARGHLDMEIGIRGFQTPDSIRLPALLVQPLR